MPQSAPLPCPDPAIVCPASPQPLSFPQPHEAVREALRAARARRRDSHVTVPIAQLAELLDDYDRVLASQQRLMSALTTAMEIIAEDAGSGGHGRGISS